MTTQERITAIDDKEAGLACIFFTRAYSEFSTDLLDVVDLKLKYLKEAKKMTKLLMPLGELNQSYRSVADKVLAEATKLWDLGLEHSPEIIDYLLTNTKFVNKRAERLEIAKKAATDPDSLSDFLAAIEDLHSRLEKLGVAPIKIHKLNKILSKVLVDFLTLRELLDNRVVDLEIKCSYLYRGIN